MALELYEATFSPDGNSVTLTFITDDQSPIVNPVLENPNSKPVLVCGGRRRTISVDAFENNIDNLNVECLISPPLWKGAVLVISGGDEWIEDSTSPNSHRSIGWGSGVIQPHGSTKSDRRGSRLSLAGLRLEN